MSYQVLARKWRPKTFADMVGQSHVLKVLTNALNNERLHHAYLFTGTRGVGKTTLARILAKCLNCEGGVSATPCARCHACTSIDEGRFVDLIEVDAASKSKVDETRELMDNVQYTAAVGRYKVYLIDEVHMFSGHSFNALLKTLEEPPSHVKFLLATTESKKIPITILSRCLQFNLKQLSGEQIEAQLKKVLTAETIESDKASRELIAHAANGSLRDALSLLDQAINHGGGRLTETEVRAMLGTIDGQHLQKLVTALIDGDATALIHCADQMAADHPDYDMALAELLALLQKIAVHKILPSDTAHDQALKTLAEQTTGETLQLYYQIGMLGRRDLPYAPDPRMGFEMTLIRMLAFRPAQNAFQDIPATTAKQKYVTPSASHEVTPATTAKQKYVAPSASHEVMPATTAKQKYVAPSASHEVTPATTAKQKYVAPSASHEVTPATTAKQKYVAPSASHEVMPATTAKQKYVAPSASHEVTPATTAKQKYVAPSASHEVTPATTAKQKYVAPSASHEVTPATQNKTPIPIGALDWRVVVDEMNLDRIEGLLARHSALKECREDRIILELPSKHKLFLKPDPKKRLEEALQKYLEKTVKLTINLTDSKVESPVQKNARKALTRQTEVVSDIKNDANILAMGETFDATLDEKSIRPN